jgi:DNA-binding LacI/PurR family transcriptional regulator
MSNPTTVASIARAAGVCKSTVSLALRNSPKVTEATRLRVQAIAKEACYRPNPLVTAQMAHIRLKKKRKRAMTIGFLSTWIDGSTSERLRWSVIGDYCRGARDQAEVRGVDFELLEFDRVRFSDRRIGEILRARNIEGLVLAPLRYSDTRLVLDWSKFALAAIGYYQAFGNIHRVFFDNFHCMQSLLGVLASRQYQRIGFITNQETEARTGYLWSGGFLEYQYRKISESGRVPPLNLTRQESLFTDVEYEQIHGWYREHRPDVIIGFLDKPLIFLKSLGYRVKEDFGYVALSWTHDLEGCCGYYQSMHEVGAAAFEAVAERLYRNERGIPFYPTTTLLTGKFIEGNTLRPSSVVAGA